MAQPGRVVGFLDGADLAVLALYFVIVFAVGVWSSCRNRGSVGGYFLAGRSMHWLPVGASLFASNIGSGHFVGLAGDAASGGIAIAVFEFNAVFVLCLLGWLFLPVYIVSGITTMPEYLRKRFGGQRIRVYLALLTLLLYIFTKISADLYAGGVFIQQSMEISMYPAVIMLLIISALFTIMGGLTAVIWTDFAQTIIMLIGALFLMIRSFQVVGGFDALVYNYFNAIPNTTHVYQSTSFIPEQNAVVRPDLYGTTADRDAVLKTAFPEGQSTGIYADCAIPLPDALNFMKAIDSTDLPWTGAVFGLTVNATWYWCTDQVIVQRTLAAKNMIHAKGGIILACLLKMTPLWLMIVPGMIARILFTDTVACGAAPVCTAICGKPNGCSDVAYPFLVLNLLPSGARGLMLAVMMASLVSSLTSIFNSTSTIFTMDVWRLFRPHCKDSEVMIVGRIIVVVLVGIGIAWIPIVQLSDELFDYIQSVTGFLAPPICAVFVLAVFWRRTTEIACFSTLLIGLVIGLTRFFWEISYPKVSCGEVATNPPHFLVQMHYLHFSIMLFGMSMIMIICASLVTKPLSLKHVFRKTYYDRHVKFDYERDGQKLTIVSEQEKRDFENEYFENLPVLPWYKKCYHWLCGVEKMQDSREPVYTQDEAEYIMDEAARQASIEQNPKEALIVNVCMAMVLGITVFVWGFFA